MKTKWIGLISIMLVAVSIVSYKAYSEQAVGQHIAQSAAPPRVLLVADLSEAKETGDACAEIIHLVRAAHDRGVDVEELNADSQSNLIRRYHVLVIPSVLIFSRSGKVVARYEGEGKQVVNALRIALAQLR